MTLLELFRLLRRHLKLVILLPVIAAVAMAAVSILLMTNDYTARTSMYVLAQSGEPSSSTLQSTLSASQLITNDVAALIDSDRVTNDVASELGMKDLEDFDLAVTNDTTTRVITLEVTGKDPQQVADVANAVARDVSEVAQEVMEVQSVNVIDEAQVPEDPSGPNRKMYVAVALMGGLFLAVAIVVLQDMLNNKVRDAAEVEELLGIPVIGQFPATQERG